MRPVTRQYPPHLFGEYVAKKETSTVVKEKMPNEYVPTSLRPVDVQPRDMVTYACGYEQNPGSFGMFAGHFPTLAEALEVVPDEDRDYPCIVRFNLDGTDEVVYRWIATSRLWAKCI